VANSRISFPRFPPLHWGKITFWSLEAGTATRFVLGLILLGLAGLLYLSLASQIATTSVRIRDQWEGVETLRRERDRKVLQLAEQLSLPRLQAEAERRGFGPLTEVHPLAEMDQVEGRIPTSELAARGSDKRIEGSGGEMMLTPIEARLSRWWEGLISRFATWATVEARKTP
jgi:hypothetical protein